MRLLRVNFWLLIFLLIVADLPVYGQKKVFFGNGVHNGWADQTSIIIWSRLTTQPEMNRKGKAFIPSITEDGQELKSISDESLLLNAQMPLGAEISEMMGACPGSTGEIRLTYFPENQSTLRKVMDWQAVEPARNFTAQWKLENLKPGTAYSLVLEGRSSRQDEISATVKGGFQTAPAREEARDLSFCVVSCHDYRSIDDSIQGHKIYRTLAKLNSDFYVHTGDVEYYDRGIPMAVTESLARFKWDRLFALPFNRNFWNQTTSYFQKDDHDALIDDSYPGTTYGTLTFERGIEIFDKEQFPANDLPFKTIRWGKQLQIWLVEGRNFRSPNQMPDGPEKSIWGKEQKQWFFKTVQESDADFKILLSPTPILGPDRKNKFDNHANENWKAEGDEIRNFINDQKNLFIICGDRHWQYVTHLPATNLWEFGTGGGSDKHAGGWPADDKRAEHRFLRVKGGFVQGKLDSKLQKLILSHHDVDGRQLHSETFELQTQTK